MALPNIQNAQYGDRASLEKLGGVRRTNNPAAGVNGMKDMVGGRPAETDPVKLALKTIGSPGRAQQQISPEEQQYASMWTALGEQYRAVKKLVRLASSPDAGPMTRQYALAALQSYYRNHARVRSLTPFLDELP